MQSHLRVDVSKLKIQDNVKTLPNAFTSKLAELWMALKAPITGATVEQIGKAQWSKND